MKTKYSLLFTTFIFFVVTFNTSGQVANTFAGDGAGTYSTGNFNSGFGKNALNQNTNHSNSAFGNNTLTITSGGFNCAFGNTALMTNTSGSYNCALGTRALSGNNTGWRNIAIGHRALEANITGNNNTGVGYASLLSNVGNDNVALGFWTPRNLLSGDSNVFIGTQTAANLLHGSNNVFLGKVIVKRTPSTTALAGNDTNGTIIFADGSGKQRIFVHNNGNTGIGLGNNVIPVNKLDIKGSVVIGGNYTSNGTVTNNFSENTISGAIAPANGLLVEGKVGIGNTYPKNKVEITQGTLGNSGLRFTNLTSNYNPTTLTSATKFLSVNATGDVVLQKLPAISNTNSLLSNDNLMTSNVNSIVTSANIINSISNTINASNQLVTTVNGVVSAPVNIPIPVDGSATNELQTLSQTGNTVTLSNGGGSFLLPTFTDTDSQSLGLTGNILSISNGNSVTLPSQVPQTLNQSGNTVTLSNGGGSFTLPTFTEVPQTISQSGNTITLSNGGGTFTLPTDTDAQSLALAGNILSISNGNSVTLPAQIPQSLSQSGNTVTLSNGGGTFTLPTDTDTDAQSLALAGNILSISNGNSVTLPAQIPQSLSQSGNTVTLSNGGGSFTLPTFTDTDTDAQSLSITGNVLSISNGNSVILPAHGPQSITQNGAIVTLSNGGGSITLQSSIVTAGNNVSVLGNGTAGTPYVVSSTDTSLYADNGNINPATTVSGNRIVSMNGSNIWFNSGSSQPNGKIYIGSNASYPSTTGNYKLFVEGGILTEKVKVALRNTSNWADYVFADNYKLMPLKEVEKFVAVNKHLPGIDSASELSKNGLDLAEMQSKQMQKIEELTLYIINQNKTIENNQKEMEALKLQVKALIEKTK